MMAILFVKHGDLFAGWRRRHQTDHEQCEHAYDQRGENCIALPDHLRQVGLDRVPGHGINVPESRQATAPSRVARRQKNAAITTGVIAAE